MRADRKADETLRKLNLTDSAAQNSEPTSRASMQSTELDPASAPGPQQTIAEQEF